MIQHQGTNKTDRLELRPELEEWDIIVSLSSIGRFTHDVTDFWLLADYRLVRESPLADHAFVISLLTNPPGFTPVSLGGGA
jgi:hypothetical protein